MGGGRGRGILDRRDILGVSIIIELVLLTAHFCGGRPGTNESVGLVELDYTFASEMIDFSLERRGIAARCISGMLLQIITFPRPFSLYAKTKHRTIISGRASA